MITPYAIPNCPRAKYDAIEAINQSRLKHFEKSAAHFKYEVTKPRSPPSKAMVLGSLTEHLDLGNEFVYEPMRFKDFKTKEAQNWRDECEARGIPIVNEETMAKAQIMARKLQELPESTQWKPWRISIALVGFHKETGLAMKGLVDVAPDNHLVIGDDKTTEDASDWGFGNAIANWGYDIQAWWYQELWKQVYNEDRQFACRCVENEPPHCTSIQVIRQDNIDRAGRMVGKWMAQYAECLRTNVWPGYPSGLTWAKVPSYRFRDV